MRPKIDADSKLSSFIIVRVSENEKAEIMKQFKQSHFVSLSQYARNRLLKKRLSKHITISAEYYQVFRSLDYQIAKLGNNMNQIAQKLNAYNTYLLNEEDKLVIKNCYHLQKDVVTVLSKYLKIMQQ